MPTASIPAPAAAHSRALDLPAVIAASVPVLKLSEALARAGLVGRHDPDRGVLVIEPASSARVIPFPGADPSRQDTGAGIAWYNSLSCAERLHWHEVADSAVPADAWRAFQGSAP